MKTILPVISKYNVIMKISSHLSIPDKNILDTFKISIHKEFPEKYSKFCSKNFNNNVLKDQIYLTFEGVDAYERYSAVELAKRNIARVHDLLGLYYHKGKYCYGEVAFAHEVGSQRKNRAIPLNVNRMHFVDDNKPFDAARLLSDMFDNLLLPGGIEKDFLELLIFMGLVQSLRPSKINCLIFGLLLRQLCLQKKKEVLFPELLAGCYLL